MKVGSLTALCMLGLLLAAAVPTPARADDDMSIGVEKGHAPPPPPPPPGGYDEIPPHLSEGYPPPPPPAGVPPDPPPEANDQQPPPTPAPEHSRNDATDQPE